MPIKPRIKFQANNIPLIAQLNTSIVRKRLESGYVNFTNKTDLTDYVDQLYNPPMSDTYLYIVCQCKKEFIYTTKSDVPSSNVICNCGRKVIIYG